MTVTMTAITMARPNVSAASNNGSNDEENGPKVNNFCYIKVLSVF
jgi:hypothetical protein